jgi:transcriptional antiterminator
VLATAEKPAIYAEKRGLSTKPPIKKEKNKNFSKIFSEAKNCSEPVFTLAV